MSKLLTPLILIIVAIALFFTFTQGQFEEIEAAQIEEASYDQALARARELRVERERLFRQYNDFPEENRERLNRLLPDNVDTVRLIIEIDKIAESHNMSVREPIFIPQRENQGLVVETESTRYETINFEFSVTGRYNDFLSFMRDLERSLRLVDVDRVTFGTNPGETDTNTYKVRVKTYWLKDRS